MESASRTGARETATIPPSGVFISRIRNIAMEVDIAPRKNVATIVALGEVNSPNEPKMMHSHNTSVSSSGVGI